MALKDRLSITEVAKSIGVTPRTIMRWEKSGKIKRSKRDWRGWRFYLNEDLEGIRKFYESSYEYYESARSVTDFAKTAAITLIMIAAGLSLPILMSPCHAQAAKGITQTGSTVDINLDALPVVQAPSATVAEAMKYTLGPDDVIEIDVRRHPEFSGQYPVNSEGKIEYKFVGDILVAGLTKVELQERLAKILSEYIIEPDVNVRIVAYLSKVFYVVGEVNNPGKFYMKGNTIPVREALINAGLPAVGSSAMRKCRLITPDSKGRSNMRYVNAYELLYGGDLRQNVDMKPGDVLYVPATIVAKIIRVVSPVTSAVSATAGQAAAGAGMVAAGL